jgi:hypothetical protein
LNSCKLNIFVIIFLGGLDQCAGCYPVTIFWQKPIFPAVIITKGEPRYIVYLSKDKAFNPNSTTKHIANDNQFEFLGLIKDEGLYYVSVSALDADGFESPRSQPMVLVNSGIPSTTV